MINTRVIIGLVILAIGALVGFLPTYLTQSNQISNLQETNMGLTKTNDEMTAQIDNNRSASDKIHDLEAELSRLILNSASGGGINMKYMLHPETLEPSVPLPEVFSFDANHAFCRVDTNPEAFVMRTHSMGDVLIEKHEFFMAMTTTTIDEFKVSKGDDGKNKVVIAGGLDCFTEVAKANMKIGSKTAAEPAQYRIKASDGGLGGGTSGDTFEFTVFFDPNDAPINYAIFGPEFTFTGDMTEGEITIPSPR